MQAPITTLILSLMLTSVATIGFNVARADEDDKKEVKDTSLINTKTGEFSFGSSSLKDGDTMDMKFVFNSFGCSGKNLSPELHWANPPSGTKSFALTVYDPDAPTGSGWWHWTVFNIPAKVTELREGEKFTAYKKMNPETKKEEEVQFTGVGQGRTDFGKPGYGGPCPPEGDQPHHYVFTLYAMKEAKLSLNKDSSGAMVGFMTNANSIAKKTMTVMFGRGKSATK